jgi:hypothetical protein
MPLESSVILVCDVVSLSIAYKDVLPPVFTHASVQSRSMFFRPHVGGHFAMIRATHAVLFFPSRFVRGENQRAKRQTAGNKNFFRSYQLPPTLLITLD